MKPFFDQNLSFSLCFYFFFIFFNRIICKHCRCYIWSKGINSFSRL